MRAITSNKWVLLLVVFLVMTNLALVFFAFTSSGKPAKPQENNFRKQIGLSADQEKIFDQRKEEFFKVMRPRWEEANKLKDSLYQYLDDEHVPDSVIEYYTKRWTELNRESDIMLFRHMKELRKVVRPDQYQAFDTAVSKMVVRRRR